MEIVPYYEQRFKATICDLSKYPSWWIYKVAKKRKSGGRSKGKSGRTGTVQCSKCGQIIPADKAKKFTKRVTLVDPQLARELRSKGAYIHSTRRTQYYCVSCAIHSGKLHIRQASKRKKKRRRR